MPLINLTTHPINLPGLTIPSAGLARVAVQLADDGLFEGVPIVRVTYGEVTGLPNPQDGVLYIVSALVRAALPNRQDLASPAKLIRDSAGNITGCEALEVS